MLRRRKATPFRRVMGRFESFAGLLTFWRRQRRAANVSIFLSIIFAAFRFCHARVAAPTAGGLRRSRRRKTGRSAAGARPPGLGPGRRIGPGAAAALCGGAEVGEALIGRRSSPLGLGKPDLIVARRALPPRRAFFFPPPAPAMPLGLRNLSRFRPGAAGSPPGPRSPRFGPGSPSPRWFWL